MTGETISLLKMIYFDLMLWFAVVILVAPLKHRDHYRVRILAGLGSGIVITVLLHYVYPFDERNPMTYLGIYAVMACLFFWFCAKLPIADVVYGSIWALMIQQSALEIWQLVMQRISFFARILPEEWTWVGSIPFFTVAYLIVGFTVARFIPENGKYKIGPRQLISATLLGGVFEILFVILMNSERYLKMEGSYILATVLSQFYCITVFYLQTELFKKSAMKQELEVMNHLWHQQKAQYSLAKENIALINHKCHDLKHQIRAIQTMASEEERNRYVEEVRNSIQIYDSIVTTGNEVLDTVLTEKSLYCEANEIKISCIADGSHLNFMNPIDLYAIFGNALDNAIESVSKFKNKNARMIDVLVRVEKQFLVINIINPVQDKLKFQEDLPISTKSNNGMHGFGLRSIRHNVKKYDGFLKVKVEHGCFELKILIPIP